jgi:hypothetical protein
MLLQLLPHPRLLLSLPPLLLLLVMLAMLVVAQAWLRKLCLGSLAAGCYRC